MSSRRERRCAALKQQKARSYDRAFLWMRGLDLNQRPSGYEPDELPDCSTPRCQPRPASTLTLRGFCTGSRQRGRTDTATAFGCQRVFSRPTSSRAELLRARGRAREARGATWVVAARAHDPLSATLSPRPARFHLHVHVPARGGLASAWEWTRTRAGGARRDVGRGGRAHAPRSPCRATRDPRASTSTSTAPRAQSSERVEVDMDARGRREVAVAARAHDPLSATRDYDFA